MIIQHSEDKVQNLTLDSQGPAPALSPLQPHLPDIVYPTLYISVLSAFSKFLKCVKSFLNSGPLHLLFRLPGTSLTLKPVPTQKNLPCLPSPL